MADGWIGFGRRGIWFEGEEDSASFLKKRGKKLLIFGGLGMSGGSANEGGGVFSVFFIQNLRARSPPFAAGQGVDGRFRGHDDEGMGGFGDIVANAHNK
jgi:hypothetical protein